MAELPDEAIEAACKAYAIELVRYRQAGAGPGEMVFYAPGDKESAMRAAIAALGPWIGVPEGWVLVPEKVTEAMGDAVIEAHARAKTIFAADQDWWDAALAAAPPPPAKGGK